MSTSTRSAAKQDTRLTMLDVAIDLMLQKGYTNTGIQEIVAATGVPKGSFYHFFDSKESFGVAIIQHYDQRYLTEYVQMLQNAKETPLQRLKTYCQTGKQTFESGECRKGCLIGNLSQEMSDQSETLRKELSNVIAKWNRLFAECIKEGQDKGEITRACSADQLAEIFHCGWSGAVMRAKTVKNTEPMDTFIELMFNHFLKKNKA